MNPADAVFLIPETRTSPMHVGGLQVFELPPDHGPDHVHKIYERLLASTEVAPLFRRRPHRSPATLAQWTWVEDDEIDLEHHVRHSALPHPGTVRELLALVSRLHGSLLDRSRPLWEAHLIEGLEGDRFAVYTKIHHALADGVNALRIGLTAFSIDPNDPEMRAPWAPPPERKRSTSTLLSLPAEGVKAVTDLVGLGPRVAKRTVESFWREQLGAVPKPAPKTMFNVNITGARRFAAQSWELARIKAVGRPVGATVNDVILAMCGGSLRSYLHEQDALPDASLIAMVPVSLAPPGDAGGNAVGATLCGLGTDLADPVERLEAVHENQVRNKEAFAGLSKLQATALSVPVMAPLTLNAMIGLHRLVSPFNLVISNVPGPPMPLYWGGAHLQGMWPLSIPMDGQALNITVLSNDGKVGFGLTGCRSRVPHLQRMLTYLEDDLAALEKALL